MTKEKLIELLEKQGKELMVFDKMDDNLIRVLCGWNGEYVIWTYNVEFNSTEHGYYFNDFMQAYRKFKKMQRI